MNLYEAVNGAVGESYVRSYVWAESVSQARTLATQAYAGYAPPLQLSLRLLFTDKGSPFATHPSDHGWEAPRS